jgi:multiple sugar transport system substrate-binding protein
MKNLHRSIAPASLARVLALALAAVLAALQPAQAVEVKYMLWDSNQMPAYRQCAAAFEQRNPGITIKITQSGWGDYWTAISTGIISGTAPDVFTNHLAKYPELVKNEQLVDLAPLISRDRFDPAAFTPGLFSLWGRDGQQFGLPKDWDTVGLVVNMAFAKRAGVSLEQLQTMNWNPVDGGSFEQVVRKLTRDAHGNDGTSAQFSRKNVSVYGYQNPGPGGMTGQTEWSHFAASAGFSLQDKPWDTRLHYDDPRLAQTLGYLAGLPDKGLSARFELTRSLGSDAMFVARKAAMVPQGSWMISYFAANAKFEHAWVPLPIGPSGQRASMLNGLADSIWVGSKVKEEAWKWVRYLGSAECQRKVADVGVVFPSVDGLADRTLAALRSKGVDASAFLLMSRSKTFPTPIAEHGAEITEVMTSAIESVLIGKSDAASALKAADARVRRLITP